MNRTQGGQHLGRHLALTRPVLIVAGAIVLSLITTVTIDATYGNIGAAAVPYVLVAYVLGVAVWGVMRLALPGGFCFLTAVAATCMCVAGALTGSNLLSWLIITSIGGLMVTAPGGWAEEF